jgi:triacylglycerol lipase
VFSSLAPARRRLIVILLAVVLIAALAGVIAAIAGRSGTRAAAVQNVPGPVMLVPGYGGSVSSMQPLASALTGEGKIVQGDLDAQAVVLGKAVDAAMREANAASVDVVGYSAGGVVARLWARDHGGAAIARRIVTIGSPQHGTQLATLGALVPGACPVACQQLALDSPLLNRLNTGDETPAGPQWLSIWTTHDDVVLPPDSASLAGAIDLTVQSLCSSDPVKHSGLPGDAVVQRVVIAALGPSLANAAAGC